MKHFFPLLTLCCFLFAGGGLVGCSDDPVDPKTDGVSAKLAAEAIVGVSTAELKLTTSNVHEYAYLTSSDLTAAAPVAAVIFGTGTIAPAVDGENTISIESLEGGTDYVVYVATKSSTQFGEVLSTKFRTSPYTGFVTIVERGYNNIKFHVEVQPGDTLSWGMPNREEYINFKASMGRSDASLISGNYDVAQLITKTSTINYTGYESLDEGTGEVKKHTPQPGEALVLLIGKAHKIFNPQSEQMEIQADFDFKKYDGNTGAGAGKTFNFDPMSKHPLQMPPKPEGFEESCWNTPYHATILTSCKAPEVLDAHVTVKPLGKTTRTVRLSLTPDKNIKVFGFKHVDMALWNTLVDTLGSVESAHTWAWMSGMEHSETATEITIGNLTAGITYRLIILGYSDAERLHQSVDYYDFTVAEATKPAPVMEVTGIPAPEGEVEVPTAVWFNVKCTSPGGVVTAKYLNNTTRLFVQTLNGGKTYLSMMQEYGYELSAAQVKKINSAAGYNMRFDGFWEDTSARLAVCGYNNEEVCNNPAVDPKGFADMTTMRYPDAPRVESSLFEELQGDWTAEVTRIYRVWSAEGELSWESDVTPMKVKVTISSVPAYPENCPTEAYAAYTGKTKAEVDALYADFKKSAEKYAGKVRGQNRLVCQGLDIEDPMTGSFGAYKSPVELFCATDYSCYSSDDIFYDYGAKWYLQIADDGKITVPIDLKSVAPMLVPNGEEPLYLIAAGETELEYANDVTEFKTILTSNHKTLKIMPVRRKAQSGKDENFLPTVARLSAEGASPTVKCKSIVLRKGWKEAAGAPAVRAIKRPMMQFPVLTPVTPFRMTPALHKTRLSNSATPTVVYKMVSIESMTSYKATGNAGKYFLRNR